MPNKPGLSAEWQIKLEQWHASSLTGMAWCREQNINYNVFLYWRRKLENKTIEQNKIDSQPNQFVELVEPSKNTSGIEIEYQGAVFRLSKDFDGTTFQRCFQLLRGL
jgi:hypothetical protein